MPSRSLRHTLRIVLAVAFDPMIAHPGGPPRTVAHRRVQRGHAVPQPKASATAGAFGPAGGPPEHVARGTTPKIEIRRDERKPKTHCRFPEKAVLVNLMKSRATKELCDSAGPEKTVPTMDCPEICVPTAGRENERRDPRA
jgi:hypothetical protein